MIIAFVGTPLGGKTSYAVRFAKRHSLPYFSSGEYARTAGMTEHDKETIKEMDLAYSLEDQIRSVVETMVEEYDKCVFDGFPRHIDQVKFLEKLCEKHGREWVLVYVYVNPVEMYERMEKRNRDDKDTSEILAGRARSAARFFAELKDRYDGRFIFFESGKDQEEDVFEMLQMSMEDM